MYLLNLNIVDELGLKIKQPGVYKIYCLSGSKKATLQRLCEKDYDGLLYIGASKNDISYRLKCFIKSMDPHRKQNNHAAAIKILENKKLSQFISQYNLFFTFETQAADDAIVFERQELVTYRSAFGELPPLNG
jgi:hypothetical protein